MAQTSNRFFDEVAKLMNDAAGVASGVRREFDTLFRTQAERWLRDLDLVKREEVVEMHVFRAEHFLQAANEELQREIGYRRRAERALLDAHTELEMRVQQRTAALAEANAELKSQMVERKRLESELLEIAENERRRIGFDLHDDIGQKLMGVSLLLKAVETNLTHKRVPEAQEVLKIQLS